MKKLFTLFAFLAVFLGANAIEIVDAEVDFSKYNDISEVKFAGWGASESARARLSIVDGCLHFESTQATDPTWDCQFYPIGFGNNAEIDVVYTLHFKVKGSIAENISALGFGLTPYGQFPITTEWVEGTYDYKAAGTSGDILFQCGGYVGSWDIAYLKITHEGQEEKPVQWNNLLSNGDAEGENSDVACAYAKEFVFGGPQPEPYPATIETLDGNKVFAVHAKEVNPVIAFDEDTNLWGTDYKAGDPKPDNAWQNQFWVTLPEGIAAGTQLKLSFKVKASEAGLKADLQTHYWPGDYLGGFNPGTIDITTDWTPYEYTFEAPAPNDAHKENGQYFQSIAFNLGVNDQYKRDIDFYFDDLKISEMVLDHGFFVASTNTETGLVEYDFDNAIEFTEDPEDDEVVVATVGTEGDETSWVNQVMISTVRGNNKAFKGATIKVKGTILGNDEDNWLNYEASSTAKIDLPASGVWNIYVAPYAGDDPALKGTGEILFLQVEGEELKEPEDIYANNSVITINAVERDDLSDGETVREEEGGAGETWDNQFFIKANRVLKGGEQTVIEFDCVATAAFDSPTGTHAVPGDGSYRKNAIADVSFTTTEEHFKADYTIPASDWNNNPITDAQAISFDLAVLKEANVYTIKNVKWYLKDETLNAAGQTLENLIDETGTANFFVKVGAGTSVKSYDEYVTGIFSVINDAATRSNVIYNLSGQRVSKDYKGVVIKNGRKVVNK